MENNQFKIIESCHFIREIMYILSHPMGEIVVHIGDDGDLLAYGETNQGATLCLTREGVEAALATVGATPVQLCRKPDNVWAGRVACHYGEVSI